MDALGALGIALAGGSAGATLTLLAGVPEQIRHHDRLVGEFDADLAQWMSDEMVRVEREANRHKNASAAKGQYDSGAYLRGIAHIKEEALHLYRDQERIAQRKRAALQDAEGFRHRLWRRASRCGPLPELETPEKVEPLLDVLRALVRRDGHEAPVSDPTRRPLNWALGKYATSGNLSAGWPPP